MLIVDRIEGNFAVIESGEEMINIPLSEFPANVKEGDVVRLVIDSNETLSRKKRIDEKMKNFFKN